MTQRIYSSMTRSLVLHALRDRLLTAGEVAERIAPEIAPAGMTAEDARGLLESLVDAGMVTRVPALTHAGRSQFYALTRAGIGLLHNFGEELSACG